MRSLLLAILLSSACAASTANTGGPVNVAAVRNEINGTIRAQPGNDRSIHSMGKVTAERAVVYTTSTGGTRQEETWVKDGASWKLETSTALK
jgi:hypothetical protein